MIGSGAPAHRTSRTNVDQPPCVLRGDRERLADAALAVAEERKVFLFGDPDPTTSPSVQRHEVMVGDVTLRLDPDEVAALYVEVLTRANRR